MGEEEKKLLWGFEEVEQIQSNCFCLQNANEMKSLKMEK